ncbi:MAG: sugar phosphate isomerase/epimerase, partial [Microbacterium sp.]
TSAVHVFSWWPRAERLRLHERDALWRALFAAASAVPAPPRDALLEFVPDDDPALLVAEAATLRGWLA